MSNKLKKKKFKSGIVLDRGKLLSDCFYRIFKSMQLCGWYVLYAPEFFDWDYDRLKEFSKRMEANDHKFADGSYEYEQSKEELSLKLGCDIRGMSREFPYEVKIKMYNRKIKPRDATSVIKCINSAIECSYFLMLYTLHFDFAITKDDLVDRYIPDLLTISREYVYGMTDKHLIRYFHEVEGWEIFDDVGKEVML